MLYSGDCLGGVGGGIRSFDMQNVGFLSSKSRSLEYLSVYLELLPLVDAHMHSVLIELIKAGEAGKPFSVPGYTSLIRATKMTL